MRSRLLHRSAALGLLAALVATVGTAAWSYADAYIDGQHEIAEKRAQLQDLHDLGEARAGFDRLTRPTTNGPLVLMAEADPRDGLTAAINHAAEGQQVVLDSVEVLPAEVALVSADVRLRGTQNGISTMLHALEEQTPYLIVPRVDLTVFRPADTDHGKPLVLNASIRVAAPVAAAAKPRSPAGSTAGESR